MATKAEKMTEIASNVLEVLGEKLVEDVAEFNLKTYDVHCFVTLDELGTSVNKVSQRLYVKFEGEANEEAYLGGVIRKNWQAPSTPEVTPEQVV